MKTESVRENTILQELAPIHDEVFARLRQEKDYQRKTTRDIAEHTGVPESNIDRLMRGEQTHPNAFYVAAVCAYLGLSADELLGVPSSSVPEVSPAMSELNERISESRIENIGLKKDLNYERLVSHMKSNELRIHRPLVYILIALNFVMSFALLLYMRLDRDIASSGFVLDGVASPVVYVLLTVIAAALVISVILLFNTLRERRSGNLMQSDSDNRDK